MNFVQAAGIYAFGTLSTGIILVFLHKTLGFKPKFKMIHRVLITFAASAVFEVVAIFQAEAVWRQFVPLVVFSLAVFIFFDGRTRNKLLYLLIALVSASFASIFSVICLAVFCPATSEVDYMSYMLLGSPLEALSYLLVLSLVYHIDKKGKLHLPVKYWAAAVVSFFLVFLAMAVLLNSYIQYMMDGLLVIAVAFGLFLLWVIMYFAFFFVCRYFSKLNEMSLIEMQNEMMEKYMLQKQESDRMIKILSHDLQHNLGRMKALADQSGDIQASQSITEYEQHLARCRMLDVGNDIASAVINEKRLIALRDNITFTVNGGFSEGLSLERIDICSLLGNLLDNALEAAAQTEDESLRMVELQINRTGHQLLLLVTNGYTVEPQLMGNSFISQKKNRGLHGIGMVSINNIVEKYNGAMQNTFNDNVFKSSIMLRCYD